jgi:hypothetical protein
MSYYNSSIGEFTEASYTDPIVIDTGNRVGYRTPLNKRLRLEQPTSWIDYKDVKKDVDETIDMFIKQGYDHEIKSTWSLLWKQHLVFFRTCLELYDIIAEHKVFKIDEIYFNCLTRRTEYKKFIKESRALSLQAKIGLEAMEDSPCIHDEYSGYNSIIHERYLIYWDDSSETRDWPYSMIDPPKIKSEELRQMILKMLVSCKMFPFVNEDILRILEPVAGKVTLYEDGKRDTTLLKNVWGDTDISGDWACVRKVIPTATVTRDTGVASISTLNRLKLLHSHIRMISEACPHSANCSLNDLQSRITRVRRGNVFLHIDFKKFGLTSPREAANILLELIDKQHLKLPDIIYLKTDEGVFESKRGGGSLGWCDGIFALVLISILSAIRDEYKWKMDFIVFNDDVEVSFKMDEESFDELELKKNIILTKLEDFGFLISWRKVFSSRMSIFLESYSNNLEGLYMEKDQLAITSYAKSLTTRHHWKAKYNFSEGYKRVRCSEITELCVNSLGSDNTDWARPYEVGGWTTLIDPTQGLNCALRHADRREIEFYISMTRYKEPHLMPEWIEVKIDKPKRDVDNILRKSEPYIITDGDIVLDESRQLSNEELNLIYFRQEVSDNDSPPPLPHRIPPVREVPPEPD